MPKLKARGPRLGTLDTRRLSMPAKIVEPFYTSAPWRQLMARIIAQRGRRCQDPEHKGRHDPTARIFGDHIVERRDGGADLDEANVLLRCGSCHTSKTAAARQARLRG